jgi:hypothetical protein
MSYFIIFLLYNIEYKNMNKIQPAMEIPEQVYQDLPKNVPG